MQTLLVDNFNNITIAQRSDQKVMDSRDLLDEYGLTYHETGPYLQVGETNHLQSWILHISAIRFQFIPLLKKIIPELIAANVTFQIAKDKEIAKYLLDGSLGLTKVGKLICVFPVSEEDALILGKKLIALTLEFRAPDIPTDSLLGGTVYTMYGCSDTTEFTIPFLVPEEIRWPFSEISEPFKPVTKKLWNNKYKPLIVIKQDFKGRVIQGNYFKSIFNIKLCLIKEAVKNMWADEYGRDIVDRLLWQYELYLDLPGQVSTPKILDCFQEQGNTYLVMEFIKGESLDNKLSSIYEGYSWFQLSKSKKIDLINIFLKLLTAIEQLHKKNYIHRDITPANFIITKKGQVYLIDMELTYSLSSQKPNPAFKLGTPGYMSPEQINNLTPTLKEDIYGLGALMVNIFTGLSPVKINTELNKKIQDHLSFFTESIYISSLIEKCMHSDPGERPTLLTIKKTIENYRKDLENSFSIYTREKKIEEKEQRDLKIIIEEAIAGLCSKKTLSADLVWHTLQEPNDLFGTQSTERIPQAGFHRGLAGILYLLARAKQFGYNIDICSKRYIKSWEYIHENSLNIIKQTAPGLWNGLAGIALAIHEGIKSGLLVKEFHTNLLKQCFETKSSTSTLAEGIAGQGLALLHCSSSLTSDFYTPLLQEDIATLLSTQQKDGSWKNLWDNKKKDNNTLGFSHGTAGIICFLIAAASFEKSNALAFSIEKGLSWLSKNIKRKKDHYYWNTSTKSRLTDDWSCDIGTPGIALAFIQGYNLLGTPSYKRIAQSALLSIPKQAIHSNYTQSNGLAGIGEVYLEANRIFKTNEWQERIDWIKGLFIHTFLQDTDRSGYWSVNIYPDLEPDLMTGISGVIHFLMRAETPDLERHILLGQ